MQEYKLFINGSWVDSSEGGYITINSAETGSAYAKVQQASKADAIRAIEAAQNSTRAWRKTPPSQREAILNQAANIVEQRKNELMKILRHEAGSTILKSMMEIHGFADSLRNAAGESRRIFGQTYTPSMPGMFSYSIRRPLGVVAAISPFNFPLILSVNKVAMALAAGNTCVLKPSEATPIAGLKIAEYLTEAGVPAGVVNVIPGQATDLGDILISHPAVRMIAFTGSSQTGKAIAVKAAEHMKRVSLELGGKNALIVLADADIDYAVNTAAYGSFMHQGQVCMSTSRIIVHADVYDEFCDKFATKSEAVKSGSLENKETIVGPLIRTSQCEFIDELIKEAQANGAKVLVGGSYEGAHFAPTVVANVTPEMRLFHEECFGPVTAVVLASDDAHALKLANDSSYGLSAAVHTRNINKAMQFSEDVEAGMVHINGPTANVDAQAPFGGVKDSGLGKEGGHFSIEEMTELKWITIQSEPRKYPF